jgi:hypothetical protein
MIENWESLVLGGVGGLATSGIVQYIQYLLEKKRNKELREEDWYMDLITTTHALRRRAGHLDASITLEDGVRTKDPDEIDNNELAAIVKLIQDLREIHDRMPIQFYDSQVNESLSELTRYYNSETIGEEDPNIVEFKRELREETKSVFDSIEKEYEKSPELY